MDDELVFESETDLLRYQVRWLRNVQHKILEKYKEDLEKLIKVEDAYESLKEENKTLKKKLKKLNMY